MSLIITIDTADSRPVYRQISDEIKSLLVRGELNEGASLPSVRQMAADLGINMNTVATAYRELQNEGLITIKHGSGATVSANKTNRENKPARERIRKSINAILAEMILAGWRRDEIINFVSNELGSLSKGEK